MLAERDAASLWAMSQPCPYAASEVRAAGWLLAQGNLAVTADVIEAFKIAHAWRMARAYPVLRSRIALSRMAPAGTVSAGRVKRMSSIRKKLARSSIHLDRMQDLAGIRAIAPDMDGVRRIAERLAAGAPKVNDYIAEPKAGGYRSLHIIRPFDEGGAGADFSGIPVEIQIRTRLQHAWATAVEAVGMMRGEDMKAGQGDAAWLRLFEVMAGHMAAVEGCPIGSGIPVAAEDRRAELLELNAQLGATDWLGAIRVAVNSTERPAPGFYRLSVNARDRRLVITPSQSLEDQLDRGEEREGAQSVSVAVDDAISLRLAYPNYFLDVGTFLEHLRAATGTAPPPDFDVSFLRDWEAHRRRSR